MSFTLDANVLLYASDESSPFHGKAREVLVQAARGPDLLYLFWPTTMAYLRIATHPAVFARPLSAAEAMANINSLLGLAHVRCPGEGDGFWARYLAVAGDRPPRGNLVPDAHLVALMLANEVPVIWSHDRDLRRFPEVRVRDPFV